MASSIYNEFISQKNKGLIWDFMYKNKMFDGIPPVNVNNVKQDFDSHVAFMSTQITSNDNLVDLNKKMISSMITNLNKYKQVTSNIPSSASATISMPIQPQSNRSFVTAEEISQEKQTMFNRALQTKQEEFNNYNKKPVPESLNFSDGSQDKPIGAEMDKMLQEAINWRQKQLNMVYDNQDQSNALNWINKDQDPKQMQTQQSVQQSTQQNMQNNKPKILKIGQDTNLDNNVVINIKENQNQVNKKVNFSDKIENINNNEINNNNNDFLSLLKRKSETNTNTTENNIIELNENNNNQDELIKMLKEILANQSRILELLTNRNV